MCVNEAIDVVRRDVTNVHGAIVLASMGESCRASCVLHFPMLIVAICINAIERAM